MPKIYKSVAELVGHTPLIELGKIKEKYQLSAFICAKLEFLNPAGSVKDRVALGIISDAEKRGILKKGGTIIEPTSGNTGIGLASIGASMGYKVIIVMPDNMSKERISLMEAYGAKVILTDGKQGMKGAIEKADELALGIEDSFIAGQFTNMANPLAHQNTTGPEIYEDTDGKIDIFVSCVGTGGTITGIGKYLKSQKDSIEIVAVEPDSSPLLSGGKPGPHAIQGIGANFVPGVLDTGIYDKIIRVTDEDAYKFAKELCRTEGILCGISSGAALCAAIELAKDEANKGKTIVALLPDTGSRYLSCGLFD